MPEIILNSLNILFWIVPHSMPEIFFQRCCGTDGNFVHPFIMYLRLFSLIDMFIIRDRSSMGRMIYIATIFRDDHSSIKSDQGSQVDDRYWNQKTDVDIRHEPAVYLVSQLPSHLAKARGRGIGKCLINQPKVGHFILNYSLDHLFIYAQILTGRQI